MATSPTAMPQGAGPQQGGAPGASQSPQPGQGGAERTQEFVQVAQAIQQLAQKYPEGTEEATAIMTAIQKWMTKAAGNPSRTPEQQAPPSA